MPPKVHLRHPHGQVQRRQGWHQGSQKLDHPESHTGQSGFPESGQYLCSRSSSGKQSRTPQRQNSEGLDHRHQDYHAAPYFSVAPPMPGSWGPPLMMYPPCPPWVGWYGPWVPPPKHFHPGWSRPTQGFGHGGYYAGDGRYEHVGHQQGRGASGLKNWIVQNTKLDHLVSQEVTIALGC
jgi:hypothetical protein